MSLALSERFPKEFQFIKYQRDNLVRVDALVVVEGCNIQYDKSYVHSTDMLQSFVNFQKAFPEVIAECVRLFCSILELKENAHNTPLEEKNINILLQTSDRIDELLEDIRTKLMWEYHLLMGISMHETIDVSIVDDWVLFVQSQPPLNDFF